MKVSPNGAKKVCSTLLLSFVLQCLKTTEVVHVVPLSIVQFYLEKFSVRPDAGRLHLWLPVHLVRGEAADSSSTGEGQEGEGGEERQ